MTRYVDVAKRVGLDSRQTQRFLTYMLGRWTAEEEIQCKTGYAETWAKRFLEGREHEASDSIGRKILENI
jgi:hypothetical protein